MNLDNLDAYELGSKPWSSMMLARIFSDFADGIDPKERIAKRLHYPLGFVLVTDPKYGIRARVKLPGGRMDPLLDRTPRDTAAREFEEETGIVIDPRTVHYADQEWKEYHNPPKGVSDHWKIYFYCDIYEHQARMMHNMHERNEGELPQLFTLEQTQQKIDQSLFLEDHMRAMVNAGLFILPFKQKAA